MSKICNCCGNILNDSDKFCTKCGAVVGQDNVNQSNMNTTQNTYVNNSASNGTAIAAMVLGIIALVFFWAPVIPVILGILGLVLGIKGILASNTLPQNKGKGMGIAGIVCGSIGMLLGVFYTIIWIVFIAFVADEYDEAKSEYNRYKNLNVDLYSQVQTIDNEHIETILDNYKF